MQVSEDYDTRAVLRYTVVPKESLLTKEAKYHYQICQAKVCEKRKTTIMHSVLSERLCPGIGYQVSSKCSPSAELPKETVSLPGRYPIPGLNERDLSYANAMPMRVVSSYPQIPTHPVTMFDPFQSAVTSSSQPRPPAPLRPSSPAS